MAAANRACVTKIQTPLKTIKKINRGVLRGDFVLYNGWELPVAGRTQPLSHMVTRIFSSK